MPLDFLQQANAAYIEALYEQFRKDPDSVGRDWQLFFAGLETASLDGVGGKPVDVVTRAAPAPRPTPISRRPSGFADAESTIGVFDLIHSYRELGHLIANLDPLGNNETTHALLDLANFGLGEADLERTVKCPSFAACSEAKLSDLVLLLRAIYCGTLSIEYMHISSKEQRDWIQQRIEPTLNQPELSAEERKLVLRQLVQANGFEQFLQTKYLGQKRFSLEGGESLVPLLIKLIEAAGERGVDEIVMGMPHRGRLNVMANVLGKPYDAIFAEFEGSFLPKNVQGDGDVKYHLGYAKDYVTQTGHKVHVALLSNPSHLEAIDPVVEGIAHAKQQYLRDLERRRVMPVLLHGDAAFTGQGIVMETMSLSELRAYHNGGTVHIIIDNQIGFTTGPREYRFTRYPSDLAKVFNAPVFHVNADDPEAAVQAATLGVEFRREFKEDVIIHLVCYRKHGHNELDDPSFTQPLMYERIREKRGAHAIYAERLVNEGVMSGTDVELLSTQIRRDFDEALDHARDTMPRQKVFAFGGAWEGMSWAGKDWSAHTAVPKARLEQILAAATTLPADFTPHPKAVKLLEQRRVMLDGDGQVDWGCAEMLAFGTLLAERMNVRLSGQDSERGTFSHRHAVLHDLKDDRRIVPLGKIAALQGQFTVINSMLSEEGVLGFEYGFSMADPRNLVCWEAQFGDFANGAQVIIDQFISSAESKWQRQSGIVLLLPHGYEGQGPEHSSARLERWLQLCGEKNMQVCYPTTPAQYFHVLRRQMHRRFRKPLILMTPKSLLRHKLVLSRTEDFTDGSFRNVIDDVPAIVPEAVQRVILCTGKIYYDLLLNREERAIDDIAIIRVEQFYPFPYDELRPALERYPATAEIFWVQEEPRNMGAWRFVQPRLRKILGTGRAPVYVGRDTAASPATGSYKIHQQEHEKLIHEALRKVGTPKKSAHAG